MNRCKRPIYRLDPVSKPFYVYCLFYSKKTTNNIKIRPRSPLKKSSKAWLKKDQILKEFLSGKSRQYLCKKYKCDSKCTLSPMLREAGLV